MIKKTISRTDEGQPRPKYIFNKCGTNIFLLYRGLVHHHHRILNMLMFTSSPSFRFFPFSSLTYFRLMLASCPELSFFPSSSLTYFMLTFTSCPSFSSFPFLIIYLLYVNVYVLSQLQFLSVLHHLLTLC